MATLSQNLHSTNKNLIVQLQSETPNCWVQRLKCVNKDLFLHINSSYEGRFFAEKAYLFYNNLGFKKLLCECGNTIKFAGFLRGYSSECKKCAAKNPNKQIKIKETLFNKYGVFCINEIPGYAEKRTKTINTEEWKQKHGNAIKYGMERNNISIPTCERSNWQIYKLAVRRFTNKQAISTLLGIENRGQGKGKMNVDHMVSVFDGFKNNIPPFIIGSIHNLQMLDAVENSRKMHKSDISISDLIKKFYLNI